jgi:hypothetical protein
MVSRQQQGYFDLAFELAYFLHVNKDIAFFIAEDALEELPSMLGSQEKHRKRTGLLRGFPKWGERTRPIRTTLQMNEPQTLQWLVYKHSESWERATERGDGFYQPTEEDMIVRYVKHLVFLTVKRSSFYVTLSMGQWLHQFGRRETRLLYDTLTQSDAARMKDMNYIGKQRLALLEKLVHRFGPSIQTIQIPGDEKQLVAQPTTPRVIDLVHGCLHRFAPWATRCVVKPGFDVTNIPGLYFSGKGSDTEDEIELNRIHTLSHPVCFSWFIEGLAKFVAILPGDSQDKGCHFDHCHQRLTVPQFSNCSNDPPRGDRFHPPALTKEDYIRLQRTLDARARRRKSFTPHRLSVYVDGALAGIVDLRRTTRVQFHIGPDADVIEVRGQDVVGELSLATLMACYEQIPIGGVFRDSITRGGGQNVTVQLTPTWRADGDVEAARVDVSYAETHPLRALSWLAQRAWFGSGTDFSLPKASLIGKVAAALALIIIAVTFIWYRLQPLPGLPTPPRLEIARPPEDVDRGSPRTPHHEPRTTMLARAAWSLNPETLGQALPIETRRGEAKTIDLSSRQATVLLSLPIYGPGDQAYPHYRLTVRLGERSLWQQSLRAPPVVQNMPRHVLNVTLFPQQLPKAESYDLRMEGQTGSGWKPLGRVTLQRKG